MVKYLVFYLQIFLIDDDCLDHKLLIAKLNAYRFNLTALKLVRGYLSNREQKAKVSSWLEIVFSIPQESILGPLFNILTEFFFILNDIDIANYADDNTPCVIVDDSNGVIASLEKDQKPCLNGLKTIC